MRKIREDIASQLKSGATSISLLILSVGVFVVFLMIVVSIVRLAFGLAT